MALKMYQADDPNKPAILAVAAGKGGVGKSTVTVNLALALANLGFRIGILDSDIYGPSMRKMLPEDRLPSQQGDRILPALCRGIKMISMAYFRKDHESATVRAPIANQLIAQFLRNVEWGELDILFIDFPPGTGDIQLSLSQQANITGAVMVTTPQEVAVLDVRKAMHMFEQVKVPILGIVENMSYYKKDSDAPPIYLFGKGGGERLARERGVPFLGAIPVDPEISRCGDDGSSLFATPAPSGPAFLDLAERVVAELKWLKNGSKRPDIAKLWQKSAKVFAIQWSDGAVSEHLLRDLQQRCPCAGCAENPNKAIQEDVSAVSIESIGRYALRIAFSSGCSKGIYSFEMLRT